MALRWKEQYRNLKWAWGLRARLPALRRALAREKRVDARRPRFYLLDPSYQETAGHYAAVARHLAAACAARGWAFFHLTGPDDPAPPPERVPFFQHHARLEMRLRLPEETFHPHAFRRDAARILGRFGHEARAVLALDRRMFTRGESYFFYYTGDLLHPWAMLRGAPPGPRQRVAVFQFYLPAQFDLAAEQTRFARHARLLARRLESREGAPVRLYTDSPALRDWLQPWLGPWLGLAFPPLLPENELAALPAPEDLANRPHPCGYFGYLSGKHGWPIIRQLLEQQAGRATRWLLHVNPVRHEEDAAAAARVAAAAGATWQAGFPPEAAYHAALARCASVLLPYRARQYAFVSSGKLVDALRHGCWPVVPAGTWMAAMVEAVGYGMIVADKEWPGVPARLAALDVPAQWAQRRAAVAAFLARFTAAALLDILQTPRA